MSVNETKTAILNNKTALGIEFGSTRIKAVLVDEKYNPIASGSYDWENQLVDNIWTYSMEKIQNGLQGCYQDLVKDVEAKYNVKLTKFAALGVSAMMHGYLAFDENDELLVPFRTWRNTITEEASEKLTELFSYHIPQRWSIAHLYQAILNGEKHVKDVRYITTLAGYIHWKLTGKKVLGNGDAAGMFPIDITTKKFNEEMMDQFDELTAEKNFSWKIREILPDAKTIGILYTTSEANSVYSISQYEELADQYGFTLETAGITSSSEISLATADLLTKVDCLTNLTDNTVVSSLPAILDQANEKGIPVFGSEIEQVKIGCLAAEGIDYISLGKDTGKMAAKILKGEAKAEDMEYQLLTESNLYVNEKVAENLGITVPDSMNDRAVETFSEISEG